MMLHWARATCGMMGRSPDFMNVTFAAWAAAADYFAQGRPAVRRQHAALLRAHPRERPDADPLADQPAAQPRRSPACSISRRAPRCTWCARRTPASSCGARACWRRWGRSADEIAVYSPRLARHTRGPQPVRPQLRHPLRHAGAASSCAARASTSGRSHFDHPLGSRFEEMDCVVFFDDVLVPWERVFLLGDVDLLNATAVRHRTSSAHSAHQGAAKNLAKCEFVLGRGAAHDADARQRAPAAHRGAARRADDVRPS